MKSMFTALSLAALSAAGSPPSIPATAAIEHAPRPVVVLVHGRGQLGLDTAALRREWKRELDTALASVGMPTLRDDDVRLAWYADALDPSVETTCTPRVATSELGLGDVTRMLFASLADAIPADDGNGARGVLGELLYFVDGSLRCAAGHRLHAVVTRALDERRPVIIVAYSLGALVSYDYLRDRTSQRGGIHLITAGSPLGAREFRELLFGVGAAIPERPAGVASWVNLYDPDDPFAAPVSNPAAAIDRRTERAYGGSAHFHGRYLRDPAMGKALAQALCDSAQSSFGSACRGK